MTQKHSGLTFSNTDKNRGFLQNIEGKPGCFEHGLTFRLDQPLTLNELNWVQWETTNEPKGPDDRFERVARSCLALGGKPLTSRKARTTIPSEADLS